MTDHAVREFVTTADIAKAFGVKVRTVTDRWTKQPDFPTPARRVSRRLVWWRCSVQRGWRVYKDWVSGPPGGVQNAAA